MLSNFVLHKKIKENMTTFKNILKFLFAAVIIFTASCLKDEEEIDYTPEREAAIISRYLDSLVTKGYDIDTTINGVYYSIIDDGEGGSIVLPGDSIGLVYIGFFPESGRMFGSSDYGGSSDGIWKYRYKSEDLIPGFDEAIGLLWEGAEGLFLVPSSQAYGSAGSYDGSIPPYSPLVFDIKIVDIYQ